MEAPSKSNDTFEPEIAGFFCRQCGDEGFAKEGESHPDFPTCLKSVKIICSESVGNDLIRESFEFGADGVLICGCLVGKCDSMDKNSEVLAHIHQPKALLKEMGLEPGRLRREWICAPGCDNVREIINEFSEQIRALGPCHLRT